MLAYMFLKSDSDWRLKFRSDPPADAFRGKVIWITGASQGLGETMALHFARLGAKLILSSRRQAELERVKSLCKVRTTHVYLSLHVHNGSGLNSCACFAPSAQNSTEGECLLRGGGTSFGRDGPL